MEELEELPSDSSCHANIPSVRSHGPRDAPAFPSQAVLHSRTLDEDSLIPSTFWETRALSTACCGCVSIPLLLSWKPRINLH